MSHNMLQKKIHKYTTSNVSGFWIDVLQIHTVCRYHLNSDIQMLFKISTIWQPDTLYPYFKYQTNLILRSFQYCIWQAIYAKSFFCRKEILRLRILRIPGRTPWLLVKPCSCSCPGWSCWFFQLTGNTFSARERSSIFGQAGPAKNQNIF